jgi:subtilisin family serine protease
MMQLAFTVKIVAGLALLLAASGSELKPLTPGVDFDPDKLPSHGSEKAAFLEQNTVTSSYIVEFEDQPVAVRHASRAGEKLDRKARHVVDYVRYLQSRREAALEDLQDVEILYTYNYAYNGAAIRLTAEQAEELKSKPGIVKVQKDSFRRPLTDKTSQYLGLTESGQAWANGYTGEDVVIGVLDSGIVPENPSFADVPTPQFGNKGDLMAYGPPPDTFTGTGCAFGNTDFNAQDEAFVCNNKILAAKCYAKSFSDTFDDDLICGGDGFFVVSDGFLSARDDADSGHGSHVSSTAAGNYGVEAIIDDEVIGTISGVAPRARISVYKVLWSFDFFGELEVLSGEIDLLAALDDAVADGVDVINFSIGGSDFSAVDVAFLNVLGAGVHAAAAAGNDGPGPQTLSFPADLPWVTAVAAGLDEGAFVVEIVQPSSLQGRYLTALASGGVPITQETAGAFSGEIVPALPFNACGPTTNDLTGKIALVIRGECNFDEKFNSVAAAGAKAIIVYNDGTTPDRLAPVGMTLNVPTSIPGVGISFQDGFGLNAAFESGDLVIGNALPFVSSAVDSVAVFSSRGPSTFSADIVKPDLIAPGQGVLAASSPIAGGVDDEGRSDFGFLDGTSMASPHIAGLFCLLKQAHPDWSPSAAKSALMTTGRREFSTSTIRTDPATPFDIGSGLPLINHALEPGIVYDISFDAFEAVLCGDYQFLLAPGRCEELSSQRFSFEVGDLNYPSIAARSVGSTKTLARTITNVAVEKTLVLTAIVESGSEFDITVSPCKFALAYGESMAFNVTLESSPDVALGEWLFGSLTWLAEEQQDSASRRLKGKGDESISVCTTKPDTETIPGRKEKGKRAKKPSQKESKGDYRKLHRLNSKLESKEGGNDEIQSQTQNIRRAKMGRKMKNAKMNGKGEKSKSAKELASSTKGGQGKGKSAKKAELMYEVYSPIVVTFEELGFPSTISGAGTSGDISVPLTFGYTGEYSASVFGPVASQEASGSIAGESESLFFEFETSPELRFLSFNLFDDFTSNPFDDLDLYVYLFDPTIDDFQLVGSSENPQSNEEIFLGPFAPFGEPARWLVQVLAFNLGSEGITDFTLFVAEVESSTGSDVDITAPTEAIVDTTSSIDLAWPSVGPFSPNSFYYGVIEHTRGEKTLGYTLIDIET